MLDDHFWIEKTGFFSKRNGYPSSLFHLLSKHAVLAGVATMTSALHRQFTKRRVAYAFSLFCLWRFLKSAAVDFCSTHITHNQDHGVMNLYLAMPTHKVICPTSTRRAITPGPFDVMWGTRSRIVASWCAECYTAGLQEEKEKRNLDFLISARPWKCLFMIFM